MSWCSGRQRADGRHMGMPTWQQEAADSGNGLREHQGATGTQREPTRGG